MKRKDFTSEDASMNPTFKSQILESDVSVVASHIFGQDSLNTIFATDLYTHEVTQQSILHNADLWIQQVLDGVEPSLRAYEEDTRPGRLGHTQVRFDSSAQMGTLIMSADRLQAQSQSNFSSVKANVCFYSGKWHYELQLESKGVMQLGWAMTEGEFSPESGVGDTVYSFSFDGNRVRKWNLITTEYGEPWQTGDIIGCTIDLDEEDSIHFYRNGRDMGEAFSALPKGPGCAYYPAISLAFDEKLQANFGSLPLKFPLESYQPVQQAPIGAVLRTNQLLHWLFRLSSTPKHNGLVKDKNENTRKQVSLKAASLLFCDLLISHLCRLLNNPYVIEACVVPFLHDITSVSLVEKKSMMNAKSFAKLNFVFDSSMLLLEPDDFKELINAICRCLLHKFNQTPVSLEYLKQKQSLELFADICQNTNIRIMLLKQPAFVKTRLPEFMNLQSIDVQALKQCVTQPWWHVGDPKGRNKEYASRRHSYFGSCRTIKRGTQELESVQERVLTLFLNNDDATTTEASSRKHFLHKFRIFLKDNHVTGLVSSFLNNQNVEQTPLSIALSFFHRLVRVLKALWKSECPTEPVYVPLSVFYTGSVDYFNIDRLGGVLSHLVHTLHEPLAAELGEDHTVFTAAPVQPSGVPSVQVQVRGFDTNTGMISTLTRWINISTPQQGSEPAAPEAALLGVVNSQASLQELLDGVIMLYNVSAHRQLQKISTVRDELDKYVTAMNDAKERLILARKTCPVAAMEIEASIQTFEQKINEHSRLVMSWVIGAHYTPEKRANLVWLLQAVLLTLEMASRQGEMFAFVPDFYVDTMVEICSAIRNLFSPTLPLEDLAGYKELLVQVAEFLVKHFCDRRVVNLSSKDTMIEALAGFISKKPTMEALEAISPASQQEFVMQLLKPYDHRPWGQSNWILMRMWQGCGFAFRYQKSPHLSRKLGPRTPSGDSSLLIHQSFEPCPSPKYQQLIADCLRQNHDLATEFLNSVLKQLNWSFSEFISMMQEIQNLSKRPERVIIDARQLKICATCFDFVISLLRVLEMLCTVCLSVFTDVSQESTENLLERLCQLLSQILLRITTPTGCFTHVISLEVPDLDSIDQFPVLSAAVGVLVALLAEDIAASDKDTKMSVPARSLLSEPAFQIESLKYVLGQTEQVKEKQDKFSFKDYPQAVTACELESVSRLISVLSRHKARMSTANDVDDEELCPICCAMPLAVTFIPCNHRSCKSCITHHLMDCKECFFCKAAIKSVVATDGKLLFDSSALSINKVTNLDQPF